MDNHEVRLAPREYSLLDLARHQGHIVSIDRLITGVWGVDADIYDHAVDATVYKVRRELPGVIETRAKRGYRLTGQ